MRRAPLAVCHDSERMCWWLNIIILTSLVIAGYCSLRSRSVVWSRTLAERWIDHKKRWYKNPTDPFVTYE